MSAVSLPRRTLGPVALWVLAVGASSPLTVLVGGVTAMYATTGVVGVPVAFLLVAAAVMLLVVGYVAMARRVTHAAPFYAFLVHGVGGRAGLAGASVALLGYVCIGASLYGLVGANLAGLFGGVWWLWAAVVWLLVGWLGRTRLTTNTRLLGGLLLVEVAVIALFDLAAFTHPAGGVVSGEPLEPAALLGMGAAGASGAVALAMAACVGVEVGPVYAEEARSATVIRRATIAAAAFMGVFYATSAWAVAVAAGPDGVVAAARSGRPGLPFALLGSAYGAAVVWLSSVLLVTSVVVAMVAFHHTGARYVFGLARERVLPVAWSRLSSGPGGGAPVAGSTAQTVATAVVLVAFVVAGADPMVTVFSWLSTVGALSVLGLLVVSSVAAYRFFRAGQGGGESWWVRAGAPVAGAVAGGLVLVLMVANLGSLLGLPDGSRLRWLAPAVVVAAAVAGGVWAGWLRRRRPAVFAGMGWGTPDPVMVQDGRLAELEV